MNSRVVPLLRGLYLVAVLVVGLTLLAGLQYVGKTHAGFETSPQLVYVELTGASAGPRAAGLRPGDRILAANGRVVGSHRELLETVQALSPGSRVTYKVDRGGQELVLDLPTQRFGVAEFASGYLPSFLIALAWLGIGALAFGMAGGDRAAGALTVFTAVLAVNEIAWIQQATEGWLSGGGTILGLVAAAFSGAAICHFVMLFPYERPFLVRRPWLAVLPYVVAVVFSMAVVHEAVFPGIADAARLAALTLLERLIYSWLSLTMFFSLGLYGHALWRAPTLQARQNARIALFGLTLGYLPFICVWVVPYALGQASPVPPAVAFGTYLLTAIGPVTLAYGIFSQRFFGITFVFRNTLVYTTALLVVLCGFFLAAALVRVGLERLTGASDTVVGNIFATALVAVSFGPLRDATSRWMDRAFFRGAYDFREVVSKFAQAVRAAEDERALAASLLDRIDLALQPRFSAAFLAEGGGACCAVAAQNGLGGRPGLVMAPDDPLLADLVAGHKAISEGLVHHPVLGECVLLPITVSGVAAGCVAVGTRKSDLAFEEADRALLVNLAEQFQHWIEQQALARKEAEACRAKEALSRYVSHQVAEVVLNQDLRLDVGRKQMVTLMFTDIRGFTKLSETMAPEDVVSLLNAYFSRMVSAVFAYHGMLDKYIGDGMMIVFGAPVARADHAWLAVQAAMRMRQELELLNLQWAEEGKPPLRIGMGIHTGECVVGNIGTAQRLDYTAIGDTVNTASRIEGLTKDHAVDILMSEATYAEVADRVAVRHIPGAAIRGRESRVDLYALEGLAARELASAT